MTNEDKQILEYMVLKHGIENLCVWAGKEFKWIDKFRAMNFYSVIVCDRMTPNGVLITAHEPLEKII